MILRSDPHSSLILRNAGALAMSQTSWIRIWHQVLAGGTGQPVLLTQASRPEAGLQPDCYNLIQICKDVDVQPTCPGLGA